MQHIKAQLDSNFSAWNVFHEVPKSFLGAVHGHTKKNVRSLPNYQNSWDVYIKEIWIWYMLKNSMTLQQFPAEKDYWNTGQIGAVVYPNFGMWMPKR
eukprot:15350446-Ditylum_brightwellii.AAC.1